MSDKFIEVRADDLVGYLNQGYEIVTSFTREREESGYISGQFMNNNISLNNTVYRSNQIFILKAGPAVQTLFGAKNEND